MPFSAHDIHYMRSALAVLENSGTDVMKIHDETSDWNEKHMVFAYNLPQAAFQSQFRKITQTVSEDASRIKQWCDELDVVTHREEWANELSVCLQALLAMIRNSDIKIYTFDNGIKKPVLLDKSDHTASSLYRLGVSIRNVEYWLRAGLTLHGSKTQKLNVNAYLGFTASNPYTITTGWNPRNPFRHDDWKLPPWKWFSHKTQHETQHGQGHVPRVWASVPMADQWPIMRVLRDEKQWCMTHGIPAPSLGPSSVGVPDTDENWFTYSNFDTWWHNLTDHQRLLLWEKRGDSSTWQPPKDFEGEWTGWN